MKHKILVIGDIMLDKYIIANVNRISPEAAVPVCHVKEEYSTLGGSGNVLRNIKSLGFDATCISRIGNDIYGKHIISKLDKLNIKHNLIIDDIPTIVKERVISKEYQTQILRIDREEIKPCSDLEVINKLKEEIDKQPDIIIVSDYAKGMITKKVMDLLNHVNIKVIVDPKPINKYLYKNVFMITPNHDEYMKMIDVLHSPFADKICRYVLHTMGNKGMILYDNHVLSSCMNGEKIPSNPVKVFNVSGAGDTVIAVMAICIVLGIDVKTSAVIANKCAEFVVTQPGTSIVPKDLFDKIITDKLPK